MFDQDHYYGNDIESSARGGLALVDGDTMTRQRILRRLMTNPQTTLPDGTVIPGDYLWQPDYGAGLPKYVGSVGKEKEIQSRCIAQMLLEPGVAQSPAPTVTVEYITNGITLNLSYYSSKTKSPQSLAFDVTP